MSDKRKQCIENILVVSCIVIAIVVMLVLGYYALDMLKNIILK